MELGTEHGALEMLRVVVPIANQYVLPVCGLSKARMRARIWELVVPWMVSLVLKYTRTTMMDLALAFHRKAW